MPNHENRDRHLTAASRNSGRPTYLYFVAEYCEAAERLKAGARDVIFPPGSSPPGLPFVGG
jgi:hypothetical protein